MLAEENELRVRVTSLVEKLRQNHGVLLFHPVMTVFMDFRILFESTVLFLQLVYFVDVDSSPVGSIISFVMVTNLDRKCDVSQVIAVGFIGMSSHHSSPCQNICHH